MICCLSGEVESDWGNSYATSTDVNFTDAELKLDTILAPVADVLGGDGKGDIWYACDDSSFPVRAFNTSGTQVNSIHSSVLPDAHGLCFDDQGFLWVSDLNADLIYKIDLDPLALERSTWGEIKTATERM